MKKNDIQNNYKTKVCIVGLGPAGIGAALKFLDSGLANYVISLDVGNPPNDRSCSIIQNNSCKKEEPCQIISGFGGCSLFGNKMSTFPAGAGLVKVLNSKDLAQRKLLKVIKLLRNYIPLQRPKITQSERKNARELFGKMGFKYKYYDAYLYNRRIYKKHIKKYFYN